MVRFLRRVIQASLAVAPIVAAAQDKSWCGPTPPPLSQPFTLTSLDSLVGKFELVQVQIIPREYMDTTRGMLELWTQDTARVWFSRVFRTSLPDTVRKARPDLGRYLGGSFERSPADTSYWWRRAASRDPDYPGVEWYVGVLRIGDRDVLDGTGDDLTVQWVAPRQFGGSWRRDNGIAVVVGPNGPLPNAEGYFCARRVGA